LGKPRIRTIAIAAFRRGDDLLVGEAPMPIDGVRYYRPVGGGVKFGEHTAEAMARELEEELGVGARPADLQLAGVLEHRFERGGKVGHEIVFVYDGRFGDASIYEVDELVGHEGKHREPFRVLWRPLAWFEEPGRCLIPEGLAGLLDAGGAAAVHGRLPPPIGRWSPV